MGKQHKHQALEQFILSLIINRHSKSPANHSAA